MKILNIAGARPNFMKIAPIMHAIARRPGMAAEIVHTGQHYDHGMSAVFFEQLGIPEPVVDLAVGSGPRLEQIELIIDRFTPVLESRRPDLVLVVGDVNSTIACARVARRAGVPVAHVEAGLRSFDEAMPEELNRVETDGISDFLFVTEPSGMRNLEQEGVPGKAFLVGNVMIDSLVSQLDDAKAAQMPARLQLAEGGYAVGTFHRPSNVDSLESLERVLSIVEHVAAKLPLVLPLHPRTRGALDRFGLLKRLEGNNGVMLLDPLGYVEFISLVESARVVVTDSGGIQEETTYLRVPCVTMRDNTERPVTVDVGSNVLAGTDPVAVRRAIDDALATDEAAGRIPELWDGSAADRILDAIEAEIGV